MYWTKRIADLVIHQITIRWNPAVDVTHDFLEGICRYDIALLLNYFITVCKYLLSNAQMINYVLFNTEKIKILTNPLNSSNLIWIIILLSSAEMLNLVANLNIIIGPLVYKIEEHLQLLLPLQEIIQIVCSTKITILTRKLLELKIFEYSSSVNAKFPKSLKPKNYFAINYSSIMHQVGPLWNICCIQFESKNCEAKQIFWSTFSRVNVCKTIALRHQLISNYRFMCGNSLYPTYIPNRVKFIPIKNLPNALDYFKLLPHNILESNM